MADSKAERAADLAWPFRRAALAGDVGGLQRCVEIVVNDLEGRRIGVIDAGLFGCELVLDKFVFDAFVGKRAGHVESKRLQIARQDFHGRDTARLDGLDELRPRCERKIRAAPQAETLGISEIVNGCRAGRRDIDDARVRQRMLQAQARAALLGGRGIAALGGRARGIGHGMGFVEHDDAVEIAAQPIHDLLHAGSLVLLSVGPQRGIGGE